MDFSRAQQILNSKDTIEVLHNGSSVWIESLSAGNNTATVRTMDERGMAREVNVTELIES